MHGSSTNVNTSLSVRERIKEFDNKNSLFLSKCNVERRNVCISSSIENHSSINEHLGNEYLLSNDGDDDGDDDDDDNDDVAVDIGQLCTFLHLPKITDEKENFLRKEENYCHVLEDLVENYINNLKSEKLNILDLFGRIDIISSYHNNTFLPDLENSHDVSNIVNCFIKHRILFTTYYDSYFKNQQNMIFTINENRELFMNGNSNLHKKYEIVLLKTISEQIQSYQNFLETIKNILHDHIDIKNVNRAIGIVKKLTNNFSKKEQTIRFVISEMVETERLYLEKLNNFIEHVVPKIRNVVKLKRRHKCIIGTVPLIYSKQIIFYEDLKKCLFGFNPNDVGDCFLQHEYCFALYLKDQQLKNNPQALEECKELFKKNDEKDFDFYAPLNRLYKYKILLQELRKSCQKADVSYEQLEEASNFIEKIISEMNGIAAINSIMDENIYLDEQGKLILRSEFNVHYKALEYDKPLEYDAMVYLFEKSIVFTEKKIEGKSRYRRDVYVYKNHIIIKNMGIKLNEELENNIEVYFHGKTKKWFHVLQAENKEMKKFVGGKKFKNMLMEQLLEEKEENSQ